MSIIQMPQPQTLPNAGSGFSQRGRNMFVAPKTAVGNALIDMGERLQRLSMGASEYEDRQARFAARNASIDVDQERQAFEADQLRRTDLHLYGGDGLQGFDRADSEYAEHLERLTAKAAEQVHPNYRSQWLEAERQENETRQALFRNKMIDARESYNQRARDQQLSRLAYGDPERGIDPDPQGAMGYLADNLETVPSTQQQKYLDDGLETIVYGLMLRDPDTAQALITRLHEESPDRFSTQTWARIRGSVATAQHQARQQQKELDDVQRKSDTRAAWNAVYSGSADPGEISFMHQEGLIDDVDFRMMMDRLGEEKEPSRDEQVAALGAIAQGWKEYEEGRMDFGKFEDLFRQHQKGLSKSKALEWTERIYAAKDKEPDPHRTSRANALRIAEPALTTLYPSAGDVKKGEPPTDPRLTAALGTVLERLETEIAVRTKAGQPVDPASLRLETDRIVAEVFRDEWRKLNAPALAKKSRPSPLWGLLGPLAAPLSVALPAMFQGNSPAAAPEYPRIQNDEEWEKLAVGTKFYGPDGKLRTK